MGAKADVQLKLESNITKFISDQRQMKSAMESSVAAARELGSDIENAGGRAQGAFTGLTGGISSTVTSMLSLGTVTGTVMKAFDTDLDDAKKKADSLRQSIESLEDVLARQGKIADLPRIRDALSGIAAGKVTRKEMEGIDATVRGALGDRADEQTIEAADKAGVRATTAGMNVNSAAQFARLFGQVSLINQRAGVKMSDADTEDAARALQKALPDGGLSDKLERGIYRSNNPTSALDLVITAAHSREGAKVLDSIAAQADEDINRQAEEAKLKNLLREQHKDPHRFAGQQEIIETQRRLALLDAAPNKEDRFAAIIAHPELAPAPQRRILENLQRGQGSYIEDAINNRTFSGDIRTFNNLRQTDPLLHAAFLAHEADLANDSANQKGQVAALTDDAVWNSLNAQYRSQGDDAFVAGVKTKAARFGNWIHDNVVPKAIQGTGGLETYGHNVYEQAKGQLQNNATNKARGMAGEPHASADPHTALLSGILQAMNRNNDLTAAQVATTSRPIVLSAWDMRRHSALKNDSIGQA